MDEDITFLRTNANGFENAERRLLDDGWKAKKYTRTTNNAIKTSYLVYLAQERAKELQRFLTPAEIDALKPEVAQLKNTKMYVRPRPAAAAAAAMNDYNEEEVFIPENERLEMIKRMRKAERPKSIILPRSASLPTYREPRKGNKASSRKFSLNLPNNANYHHAIPLNNLLSGFNKLNIGNRITRKRKRSNSLNSNLSNRRNSHKRFRYPRIRRFSHRRGSKFSNLPRATRRKYMRRISRKNK